jgi:hypothetical protein
MFLAFLFGMFCSFIVGTGVGFIIYGILIDLQRMFTNGF